MFHFIICHFIKVKIILVLPEICLFYMTNEISKQFLVIEKISDVPFWKLRNVKLHL